MRKPHGRSVRTGETPELLESAAPQRPRLAVTIGDPAGIGPEVALLAAVSPAVRQAADCVLVGDVSVLRDRAGRLKLGCELTPSDKRQETRDKKASRHNEQRPAVVVYDVPILGSRGLAPGKTSARSGRASLAYLDAGIALAASGAVQGIVTAPLSKEAVAKSGGSSAAAFTGHTEYLARATRAKRVAMMFAAGPFRLVLVTRHLPLSAVPRAVTPTRFLEAVELFHDALERDFGVADPRIAVCGLNPHAGEGGLLGREEQRVIIPELRRLRRRGWRLEGPVAPDALFYDAYRGTYDGVVCMYHDQGLIPLKMVFRDIGVNVTLGLPFVRTSPDHGTACDIAGSGRADPLSMMESVLLAARMVSQRMRQSSSPSGRGCA